MARLEVDVERLADPTAWPDRCARCGAPGTALFPVPDKYAKKQLGWRMPFCPAHSDDWDQVRRKNRLGMWLILGGMALVAGITWVVYPRFAAVPDDANRFAASFFVALLTIIPLAIVLVLWAKTPIRIEKIQGRFASIIGLGRGFKAAAVETVAPAPLPEVEDEVRFDATPYAPGPSAAPEAIGLLFLASVLLGALIGFGIALGGLELHEATITWGENDWRYVPLVMGAFGIAAAVGMARRGASPVILVVATGGFAAVVMGLLSVVAKWVGFLSSVQFALAFTGLPLLLLGTSVLQPIVWNQRIRHPAVVGFIAALGPLMCAGVVYLVADLDDGPQKFMLGVGPVFALILAGMLSSTAKTPYCLECAGWLESRRLGAVARSRAEMETVLADGGLVSLSVAKTYSEQAGIGDTELTAHRCPQCGDKGTLVMELQECKPTGKNNTPTLSRVGRWQYPGTAARVIDAIFPPPDDSVPVPPGGGGVKGEGESS